MYTIEPLRMRNVFDEEKDWLIFWGEFKHSSFCNAISVVDRLFHIDKDSLNT